MKRLAIAISTSLVVGFVVLSGVLRAQTGDVPSAHMVIANPASVNGTRAESVYQAIRRNMQTHYLASGDPVMGAYQSWNRYNKVPYRSAPHGELLVNNYANSTAAGYGRYEKIGSLPPGSVVVKDSFIVTDSGEVMTGPLFLMEKREAGFNAASNDWLYMMVHPTGEVAGITNGKNSAAVKFCADCHNKAPKGQDNLLLLPENVRR
jgi:hypothetical protein